MRYVVRKTRNGYAVAELGELHLLEYRDERVALRVAKFLNMHKAEEIPNDRPPR